MVEFIQLKETGPTETGPTQQISNITFAQEWREKPQN